MCLRFIGIIIFCALSFFSETVFAQATTEHLSLQSQVQGGMQRMLVKADPTYVDAELIRSTGRIDSEEALKDIFSDVKEKFSLVNIGIFVALVLVIRFLMRN